MAKSPTAKTLPQNIEVEEAVLGSLLIDPDATTRVATFLQANDFCGQRCARIYQAILDLHERRGPADLVTQADESERRGRHPMSTTLAEVGGSALLTGLIKATPGGTGAAKCSQTVSPA